ncbi:AMP-binding protein [Streptomyces sp. NPDC057486]|uniref:AMP-binding protein n=1 Tax=Streptomyces sp. NPDC057486 TaxID=3346145 RepID=UPI003687D3BC
MDTDTGPALHARFLRGLERSPDAPAFEVGTEAPTYAQTHRRALLWAGALVRAGARTVGVLAGKGTTAYTGILAALYAGAAVVPLRPDFPQDRTRRMLDASEATAVVADRAGAEALPALTAGRAPVDVLAPEGGPGTLVPEPGHALARPRSVGPGDPAFLLFTSGSTGRPKGVVVTHGGTDHYFRLLDERYDFGPGDAFSQTFDLNFDCALFDMFCAWGAGARLVAVPAPAYRDLPTFLAERRITVWFSTPSAIGLVRRTGRLGAASIPALRWSFFAGEALQCGDAADWERAAPASALENLYGPTELTVTVTAHRWSADVSPRRAVNGVVPVGAPHPGHELLLLDGDGRPAADEGELCVTGPQLTPGYLDPDDGRDRFLHHDALVWYRTGDRVRRLEDGELLYLGRLDTQVQVHGWRVELAEVDHALRACPGVEEAATVGVATDSGTELFAFYTGTPTPPAELARGLRRTLPEGVVPRHYRHLDVLPLNPNRKVDRSALTARAGELLARHGRAVPEASAH